MIFGSSPFSVTAFAAASAVVFAIQGTSAVSTLGSPVVVAPSVHTLTDVSATSTLGSTVVVAESNTLADSTPAIVDLGSTVVVAEAGVLPAGLALNGSVDTFTISGESNLLTASVEAVISLSDPTVTAKAVVIPSVPVILSSVGDVTTITTNIFRVNTPPMNVYKGAFTFDLVQFDYASFKDSYSRERVLILNRTETGYTVHIPADPSNRTVTLNAADEDYVVRIAA